MLNPTLLALLEVVLETPIDEIVSVAQDISAKQKMESTSREMAPETSSQS